MKKILTILLVLSAIIFAQTPQVKHFLILTDNAGGIDTLQFGLDPSATNGIDPALGEAELPPAPPSGVFDVRFVGDDIGIPQLGQGVKKDFRNGTNTSQDSVIHELKYQVGNGTVMVIKWNFPAGVRGYLTDLLGGTVVNKVMTGADSQVVTMPGVINKLKMAIKYSLQPSATITVVSPNGGENWVVGSTQTISWNATGVTTVKLEVTTNNGATWVVLGTAPATYSKIDKRDKRNKYQDSPLEILGTYQWTVPNTPSTQCKVKVSDNSNPAVSDMSDNVFTISAPPSSNWTAVNSGITSDIYSISVVNQNVAWAGADAGKVIRTTNGGTTWTEVTAISGAFYVNNVKGISATHCLVATIDPNYAGTKIYRTTNGGTSWTQVFNQPDGYLNAIHMFDDLNGYAEGDPVGTAWTLLKTTDGGATWTTAANLAPETGIYGYGNSMSWVGNTGYFGTNKNKVYKSTDQGTSWIATSTPALNSYIVNFYDVNNGILGSSSGNINRTTNGGTNWSSNISTGGTSSVYGAGSYSTSNFFATSGSNIYASTDGGATWALDFGGTAAFYHLDMKGDNNFAIGFAGGAGGYLVKYQKGTPPPTASITVTAPNGGENWVVGSTQNITWTSTNVNNVKIEYSTNNGTSYTVIAASVPASPSSYAWTIPNTPSTQCLVKISDASNASINDVSNAVFTISAAPSITVTAPNGGENWTVGTTQNITWTSTNVANVKIEYTTNNGTSWTQIVASVPATPATYAWTIPNTPSTQCKVKISQVGGTASDESNAVFTISAAPSITVTAPNGGENWTVGTTQNITWTSTNVNNVKIEYSTNNGTSYTVIAASVPASPSTYAWTIPNTPSTQCLVKISDASNATINDVSNSVFTISPAIQPAIMVTYPNDNQVLVNNSKQIFTWNSTNLTGNVNLYLSTNGGTAYTSIASNVANTGYYSFTLNVTPGTQNRFKVESVTNPTVFDVSDSNFTITAPIAVLKDIPLLVTDGVHALTIRTGIDPSATDGIDLNLGEFELPPPPPVGVFDVRLIGTDINITQLGYGVLRDYRNGDQNFAGTKIHEIRLQQGPQPTLTSTSTNKIYWSLPTGVTGRLQDFVTGTQVDVNMSGDGFASVPATFEKLKLTYTYTAPASITITSPNGGENWAVGSTQTISWNATGVTTVKLEYTTNNGTSWILIGTAPALMKSGPVAYESPYETDQPTGTYSWVVPNTPSTQCKVRVSDNSNPAVSSTSANTFTISAAPPSAMQFKINVSTLYPGLVSAYGSEFDGTYFYLTQWNSTGGARIYRVNKAGTTIDSSLVTGPTGGLRDLAWDGQYLYGSPNSTTIYKIDPTTMTSVGTITAPQSVRGIAYDKARNGLWIANWSTSIQLISMTGTVLQTIAATTHQRTGMSGLAYDTLSAGGPFIWVTDCGVAGNPYKLVKINATTGLVVDSIDITSELHTAALGGGMFITTQYQTGTVTLGGLNQGAPHILWGKQIGTITPPTASITVTAPNGGENWVVGTTQNITWTSTNVTNVKIEYTTNNGTSWIQIVASVPATPATYAWTIPNTPSTQCKVKISQVGGTASDESNAVFTISAAPTITVTAPNGGENWVVGTTQNITWTSTNVTNVKIEYSTNNGTSYTVIATSVPAAPSTYAWTIPNTPSTQCLVKISDAANASVFDVSNAVFTISVSTPATITLLSPIGNEDFKLASSQIIAWKSSNLTGNVNIKLSTDGGNTYPTTIASNVPNTGVYAWTTPNTVGTAYRVRVESATNTSIFGASANNFAVQGQNIVYRAIPFVIADGLKGAALNFGIDPTATDGIDPTLGEQELPPPPPTGVFDGRFIGEDISIPALGQGVMKDYRQGSSTFSGNKIHEIKYQPGTGSDSMRFYWNLPSGVTGKLQDLLTGTLVNVNMSGLGSYTLTNNVLTKLKITLTYTAAIPPLVNIITLRVNNSLGVPVDSGQFRTVRGTVTLGNEINSPSYFQDSTAGIALYSRGNISPQLKIGDVIQLTGRVTHFRGLTQFDSVITWTKLDSNKPVQPKVLTIPQINNQAWNGTELYEGSLVRVNGVRIVGATGNFVGNTNYNIVVGTDTTQMRVTTGTTLVGQPIPTGLFDVVGALGQYVVTAPYRGGYQILCRFAEDVIPVPATISIVAPVGGENWYIGTTQQIKWNATNVNKVKLEYTTNNGTNWILIGYASSSPYNWLIPATPTTQAKVRVSDSTNAAVNSVSPNVFTIRYAPLGAFNLVAPANSATVNLKEGDPGLVYFRWTSSATAAFYRMRFGSPVLSNYILTPETVDTFYAYSQDDLYSTFKAIGAGNTFSGQWAVWAYNAAGNDSLKSTSTFNITFNLIPASTISDKTKPTKYDLGQNYPNPFNPSTRITYQVPNDGFVNITVYNLVGEKVLTLVNEEKKAGYYEITLNAKDLNSGIYLYKMISGNFTSTKKMILMK